MASQGADAAEEFPEFDGDSLRDRVRELHHALESGDSERAETLLDDITRLRECTLFRQMGAITRQLHEALLSMQLDPQLAGICEHEIPDAKIRLDYVLEKTEQAAHRTLSAVEQALPLSSSLVEQASELSESWERFQRRELSAEDFRRLAREMDSFLVTVSRDSKLLNEKLSEVLMAQDFQDLTGQVIRRVVELVQNVQLHLVELMRKRGADSRPVAPAERHDGLKAEGPQVGTAPAANVVRSQDDVDDLLSSLGF